jgi:hypothetical protein
VAADDDFANAAISEQLDVKALHPMQIVARAYGLSERVPRDHKW